MANRLSKIRVREISLVDAPASPGAYVILAKRGAPAFTADDGGGVLLYKGLCGEALFKRDVSDEPRDDHGRWTSGGGVADAVASRLRQLKGYAARLGAKAIGAVRSGRLRGVNPVSNGGIQFEFEHEIPGQGTLRSRVQIHPAHMRNNKAMEAALGVAHRALVAYQRPSVDPVKSVAPGVFVAGSYYRPQQSFTPGGSSGGVSSTQGATIREWRQPAPNSPMSQPARNELAPQQRPQTLQPNPGVSTAQGASSERDKLLSQQGQKSPDNDMAVNVIPGQTHNGVQQPLNHPSIDHTNSNGHAYLTENGEYVPGGPAKEQEEVAGYYANEPKRLALPTASPSTSNGSAYRTQLGDVVPSGSSERQQTIEARYRMWNDYAQSQAQNDMPAPYVPHARVVSKRLFMPSRTVLFGKKGRTDVQLFNKQHKPHLFSAPPALFDKAFNPDQARDTFGRWASAGSASMQNVGSKIAHVISRLKQPSTAAKLASQGVAGILGPGHGSLGVPDELATNMGHAVEHAINALHQKIASDPHYMQFASKVGSAARNLFRKNRGRLSELEHDELKNHMVRVMSQTPLHRSIAGDDVALAAVCQGVHHRLYSQLGI